MFRFSQHLIGHTSKAKLRRDRLLLGIPEKWQGNSRKVATQINKLIAELWKYLDDSMEHFVGGYVCQHLTVIRVPATCRIGWLQTRDETRHGLCRQIHMISRHLTNPETSTQETKNKVHLHSTTSHVHHLSSAEPSKKIR